MTPARPSQPETPDPIVVEACGGFASDLKCILGERYRPPPLAPCGEPRVPDYDFCQACQVHFNCRADQCSK